MTKERSLMLRFEKLNDSRETWTVVTEILNTAVRLTTYYHNAGSFSDTTNMIAVCPDGSSITGRQTHVIRLLCSASFEGTITLWSSQDV